MMITARVTVDTTSTMKTIGVVSLLSLFVSFAPFVLIWKQIDRNGNGSKVIKDIMVRGGSKIFFKRYKVCYELSGLYQYQLISKDSHSLYLWYQYRLCILAVVLKYIWWRKAIVKIQREDKNYCEKWRNVRGKYATELEHNIENAKETDNAGGQEHVRTFVSWIWNNYDVDV